MVSLENNAVYGIYQRFETPGLSIADIAKKLDDFQRFCKYQDCEFLFAQKTKGGIVLRQKNTGLETWIIEGTDPEEWPIISENSVGGVLKNSKNDKIWGAADRLVTKMRIAPNLSPDIKDVACQVLDFLLDCKAK